MDFNKLISALESGEIDVAKEIANTLKPTYESTVNELKSYESKFTEAKEGRDKLKSRLKELAEATGLSSEDLVGDKLKELMRSGKNDEALKGEIDNLSKLLQSKEAEYSGKLGEAEKRFTDTLIEGEIAKLGAGSNVVNERALKLVIDALKSGASIEDGAIVYKDNGITVRNGAGRPISISEKMAEFAADASNAFLFKASSQGGGGSTPTSGGGSSDSRFFDKTSKDFSLTEQARVLQSNPTLYATLKG